MATKTAICNQALSNIQVSQFIAELDTDKTNAGIICRLWYEQCLCWALEDFDWNFARRRIPLAALTSTPPANWQYVYAYPSECAAARRIEIPGVRTPYGGQRRAFEVAAESGVGDVADVKVIYSDQQDAVLVYTKKITDAAMFDAHFVSALGWLLASHIALPLAVKPALAQQAAQNYQAMKSFARVKHLKEGQEDVEPAGETERARNG